MAGNIWNPLKLMGKTMDKCSEAETLVDLLDQDDALPWGCVFYAIGD